MCRFGNADGKKSLQILQWRNSSSDLVIIEKNPLIIYAEYSYHKIHLCNSSGNHGSDRRWSSIVLLIFNSTWKHCKNPCSCLETLAQKVKHLAANSGGMKKKPLIKMLVVYPGLTLHSILQRYDTSSCFFAYTVFTLCHKHIESKKLLVVTW